MNFKNYQWDDVNIEHIARHDVVPQEIEEACYNTPLVVNIGGNRYLIYGRSDSGKYLLVVIKHKGKGLIRIITARNMTNAERRLYNRKRR